MIRIVSGAPCSGKSTYVREHMKDVDLRFDFDLVATALSNCEMYERKDSHVKPLLEIRKTIIQSDFTDGDIWIVATRVNERLIKEIGEREYETIAMETSKEECLERLEADDDRKDKDKWRGLIENYFDKERSTPMNRQYRYVQGEMRAEPDEHKLSGYFAVFGTEYRMGFGVSETVDPGAFDKTLIDQPDIRCLWNHDSNIVLGRTGNGTLSLRVDDHGLFGEVTINPDDSDAMNALARIKRGDVSQCSFGFEVLKEESIKRDDDVLFVLKEIRLWEVSPVTFPAYKETSISARQQNVEDMKRREFEVWRDGVKEKLNYGTEEISC